MSVTPRPQLSPTTTTFSFSTTVPPPSTLAHVYANIHANTSMLKPAGEERLVHSGSTVHDELHSQYSLIAVVILTTLFCTITVSTTGLLLAFCKKKNTVFSLQKSEQDSHFEMDDLEKTDTESCQEDPEDPEDPRDRTPCPSSSRDAQAGPGGKRKSATFPDLHAKASRLDCHANSVSLDSYAKSSSRDARACVDSTGAYSKSSRGNFNAKDSRACADSRHAKLFLAEKVGGAGDAYNEFYSHRPHPHPGADSPTANTPLVTRQCQKPPPHDRHSKQTPKGSQSPSMQRSVTVAAIHHSNQHSGSSGDVRIHVEDVDSRDDLSDASFGHLALQLDRDDEDDEDDDDVTDYDDKCGYQGYSDDHESDLDDSANDQTVALLKC